MSEHTPIDELLLRYDELRQQGQAISPEELCGTCPELLPEVRREIQELEALNAVLWATDTNAAAASTSQPGTATPDRSLTTAAEALATGSHYRVLRLHARGGLGEVHVAQDEELHREVALKLIQKPHARDPKSRSRFLLEAEITSRLEHPNIVPVYALGQDAGGRPFYAMRFVQGETLQEAIQRFHEADKPGRDPGQRSLALRQLLSRFVAVCNTIAYAHSRGILHRDIKPGNIVLGKYGETLLVDWGLAKPFADSFAEPMSGEEPLQPSAAADVERTQMGDVIGTPAYMSPEQAAGRWDQLGPASDLYSLGATLYILLTGQPAFQGGQVAEVLQKVKQGEFLPPRERKLAVPRALEAICLKAMALKPEERYGTALELAADLEHWLADEPVRAWREPWTVRARRWLGRHRTLVAASAATVLFAAIGLAAVTIMLKVANDRERFDSLVQQARFIRSTTHTDGWSEKAWKFVSDAAGVRKEEWLRNDAAAILAGIDAHQRKHFHTPASSVAFDPAGKRLLIGGCSDDQGRPLEAAKLWDGTTTDELRVSKQLGPGPVAFRPDGTPLQLVLQEGPSLLLWDVEKQQPVSECKFDAKQKALNGQELIAVAICSDGCLLAASATGPEEKGTLAVWEGSTGNLRFQFAENASALAFSPNGALLAAANKHGRITLWSLPQGKQVSPPFQGRQNTIHCLAFSPDTRRLAAGDSSGTVAIWDLEAKHPFLCYGSPYGVHAVAFSPDGTILASGGEQRQTKLWDVATGQLLLNLSCHDYDHITGLAFSPDMQKLAVSSRGAFLNAGVYVWDLEYGRGIQTLHGFMNQVSVVRFSHQGRLLAALGHNWQVAMWELETGRLRHVLNMPEGASADNAALAFGPDGRQFAFSAGTGASLWDTATGKKLRSWYLPLGVADALAFHASGKMLLGRGERERDGQPARVYRIRQLPTSGMPEIIGEDKELDGYISASLASHDGNCFLLHGRTPTRPDGRERWCIKVLEGLTGKVQWSWWREGGVASHDPSGRLLAIIDSSGRESEGGSLVEMSTGNVLGTLRPCPLGCLSPEARYLVLSSPADATGLNRGFPLFRQGDTTPLVVLGIDTVPSFLPTFNLQGNLLAWGNSDGTVTVCNIEQIRARLAQIGLDW